MMLYSSASECPVSTSEKSEKSIIYGDYNSMVGVFYWFRRENGVFRHGLLTLAVKIYKINQIVWL